MRIYKYTICKYGCELKGANNFILINCLCLLYTVPRLTALIGIFDVIITWVRLLISNFVKHHVDFEMILLNLSFRLVKLGINNSYKPLTGRKLRF